ncbi:hypothetical protein ACHHYP_07394 [Achlya hypogyna]|uniref:Uncharacterized protein n=1 Tax=Achlya hypogyna TaxID=1202772 RepID=A0A1V9ZM26_ACHHY|nr:hypothetical protein ACHHYP_07394 [Achlya hypogyna]
MGALQSTEEPDAHECHVLSHKEIAAFYEALKASMIKRPGLPRTKPTAAEVRTRLQIHDQKKHALLVPVPAHVPPTGIKIAKAVKAPDARVVSAAEAHVRDLSARVDHDTDALFSAVTAFKATCGTEDDFHDGLAPYARATRLWTGHQYDSAHNLQGLCKVLQKGRDPSGAGAMAAKLAFRETTIVGRLKKLGVACSLASANVPPTAGQVFFNQSVTDHKLLLEKQKEWDEELLHLSLDSSSELRDSVFLDRSVMDTIYNLVALAPFFQGNLIVEAVALAETFWVHPKQFWWTAVHSCVDMDQCELLLWMMADQPLISIRHVVRTCIEVKKLDAAQAMAEHEANAAEKLQLLEMVRRAKNPSTPLSPKAEPVPPDAASKRQSVQSPSAQRI